MRTTNEKIGAPRRYRVRTKTGVEIGGAYVPKSPALSEDAEALQAALLRRRRWPTRYEDIAIEIGSWIVVLSIVGLVVLIWRSAS